MNTTTNSLPARPTSDWMVCLFTEVNAVKTVRETEHVASHNEHSSPVTGGHNIKPPSPPLGTSVSTDVGYQVDEEALAYWREVGIRHAQQSIYRPPDLQFYTCAAWDPKERRAVGRAYREGYLGELDRQAMETYRECREQSWRLQKWRERGIVDGRTLYRRSVTLEDLPYCSGDSSIPPSGG